MMSRRRTPIERYSPNRLDRLFVSGIAWTAIARFSTQFFTWAVFLVVARILSPVDIGIIAAATAVVGIVSLVAEFGVGAAIVAAPSLSDTQIRQLFGIALLFGLVGSAVIAAIAIPVAALLKVSEVAGILPVIGISVGLATINAVPTSLMRRDLRFKTLSGFEIGKSVVASGTMLTIALLGGRYWSQVVSELLATMVMTGLLLYFTGIRPARPKRGEMAPFMKMSRDVLVSRLAWYSYTNADFAIVSRNLGQAALGDYSMAWTLVTLPNEKIASLIFSVTPAIFARVREDAVEFRRYVLILLEFLSLTLIPVSVGLAIVAPDLVPVLLGAKWSGAVPLIQALAVFAAIRSVSPISAQILVSMGNAAAARRQSLIGLAILPCAFYFASRYGAVAVALVWTTVHPLLVSLQLREAARAIDLPMSQLLRSIFPGFVATILMVAVTAPSYSYLSRTDMLPIVRLLVTVVLGAASYALYLLVVERPRIRRTIDAVRQLRRGL